MVDSLARLPLSSRGGARWYSGLILVAVPDMNISLMMLGIGLPVAIFLAKAARGLRAPPGSGYT